MYIKITQPTNFTKLIYIMSEQVVNSKTFHTKTYTDRA